MSDARLFVPVGTELWTRTSDAPAVRGDAAAERAAVDRILATAHSTLEEASRSGYGETVFIIHATDVAQAKRLARESRALTRAFKCSFDTVTWNDDTSVGPMRRASARIVKDALPKPGDRVLPMNAGTLLTRGSLKTLSFCEPARAIAGLALPARIARKRRMVRPGHLAESPRYAHNLAPALLFTNVISLHGSLVDAQSFARADVIFGAPSPAHDWLFFSGNAFIRTQHSLRVTHVTQDASATDEARPDGFMDDVARTLAWSTAGVEMDERDRAFAKMLAPGVRRLFSVPSVPPDPSAPPDPARLRHAPSSAKSTWVMKQFGRTNLASMTLFAIGSAGIELIQAAAAMLFP